MNIANNANTYLPGTIWIPSSLVITNITRSYPMVITITVNTVTEDNTYIPGQLVKLLVPITYKMFQANGLVAEIIGVNGSEIQLAVDSSNFDEFILPSSPIETPASLSPSGSRNLQFNNITNKVPFQALNNRGN